MGRKSLSYPNGFEGGTKAGEGSLGVGYIEGIRVSGVTNPYAGAHSELAPMTERGGVVSN